MRSGQAPRLPGGAIVFVASAMLYAMLAARIPFYDKGEPREAMVVQAIMRDQGVVLPRSDGRGIPSKPPLFHWLAATALRAGVRPEELAIRLPSVVLGAAGVAVTSAVAVRTHGAGAGVLTALVLGSSFEWLRAATQSRVDMTLTFFVLVATLAWHATVSGAASRWVLRLGYLAATAAVLAKGPVGLVLPLLIVGVAALVNGDRRALRRLVDVPATVVMLAMCGGWYGLAWQRGGAEFATRHLVQENVQRFIGWGKVAHRHGVTYYVPVLAGAFLPWTLVLPRAAMRLLHRRDADDRFLVVWIVTVLVFFSVAAGKRSAYLLPLFPPLAILTGAGLADPLVRGPGGVGRVALLAGAGATLALALAIGADAGASVLGHATAFLEGSDVDRLPAAMAVAHERRAAIAATLAVIGASLVVLAGRAGAAAPFRFAAVAVIALAVSAGLTAFGTYPTATKLTSRSFAARVRGRMRPGTGVCACDVLDWPLRYYLQHPVPACRAHPATVPGAMLIIHRRSGVGAGPRYGLERVARSGTEINPCKVRRAVQSAAVDDQLR